jgi:multidrug efflux system membrane fusion protein
MDEPDALAEPRRPSRRSHWLGSVVALLMLAAVAGLAWNLTRPSNAAPQGPGASSSASGVSGAGARRGPGGRGAPATTVGVATATQADIPVWLDALGTVTPSATVTVRPQVSGVLQQVLFKEGQMVRTGQLLATIDARPFEMSVMQAEGQRLRDQAQLDNARLTLQRYRTLLTQDSIARQDVDTQAALVKQLEGTVVTDKANEGTARLNLAYTRIVAPVGGRLGLRVVDTGNVVSASDANGIAVITQLAPIDVEFAVPQDRVPELAQRIAQGAGMPVTVFDRTRTQELERGEFLSLNNQVDVQTGTVRAKARFANAHNALFPSQFVNVRVLLDTVRAAIVVPVTALRHGPEGDFVYVLNPDRTVSLRKVTTGQATVDQIAIASGLQAGEPVITEGGDRLKDGARVQLATDRPAGGRGGAASGAQGRDASVAGASAAWPRNAASAPWPRGGASAAWSRDGASGPWAADGASRPHRRHTSDTGG